MREMLPHIHTLFWFIMLVLYPFTIWRFQRTGQAAKLLHNLLRLSFLLALAVGIYSIVLNQLPGFYHIKGTLALLMFGLMEVSLARMYKKKSWIPFLIPMILLLVVVILMGYRIISF